MPSHPSYSRTRPLNHSLKKNIGIVGSKAEGFTTTGVENMVRGRGRMGYEMERARLGL